MDIETAIEVEPDCRWLHNVGGRRVISASQGSCMKRISTSTWVLLIGLALPASAGAIRCSEWSRLGPEARAATIDDMISSALRGSRVRRYDINRARTEQCLRRKARSIEVDFDGACAEGMRASLSVLGDIFKEYAWSCVQ